MTTGLAQYFEDVRLQSTLRAVGFSYASRERNHCEQPLASLSEPPSSAKDEYIKFEPVKRVSKLVLALARALSYVTAAFGRACCVGISREIRHVECDVLRTCSMENQTVARRVFTVAICD